MCLTRKKDAFASLKKTRKPDDHIEVDSSQTENTKEPIEAQETIWVIFQEISKEIPDNPMSPSLEVRMFLHKLVAFLS